METRYFFICLGLFPNFHANAQIAEFIKEGIEFFSKSASKNELPDIAEHLSTKSLRPGTEKEAYDFIESNTVIISDKNAIRLSEVNVFELRNGTYGH